jgi:23S rRNA (adenine1618-N6)-methyltransferase
MALEKSKQEETRLHPRNKNRDRYDLGALIVAVPDIAYYVKPNKFGDDTVDFSNPIAVKLLNKALLSHYYRIKYWEFPEDNLVPPIPGRADYIHHAADVLTQSNFGRMPGGNKITCLDIGVGANCIYPILGVAEYGWNFIGADISPGSIASAQNIVDNNAVLTGKIALRLQQNPKAIFKGILNAEEKIDITICNPPFHASADEAQKGTRRKVANLSGKRDKAPELNFAGISNELICEGGESKFIDTLISESKVVEKSCFWFSTLVSKQSNLKGIYKALENAGTVENKTIAMGTGNKSTRVVAWTFLSKEEQKIWRETRWK